MGLLGCIVVVLIMVGMLELLYILENVYEAICRYAKTIKQRSQL